MSFINRICDKVFVINLDKDRDKLEEFDKNMKKNNIKYDRFNAIIGSQVEQREPRLTDYCNTFCPDGMKGCALSHRTIWDNMVKNDWKNIMIFEDDAIVDDTFDRRVQDVWNHLPKDYDIVYFGCSFGCNDDSNINKLFKKINGIETKKINEFIETSEGNAGLYGYMISLEAAKKFITNKINWHIDYQILSWIQTYNYTAYSLNNNIVETSTDNSNIGDKYPVVLNFLLKNIKVNNLKKPITLDWLLSENLIKLGPFNINALILILILLVIVLPIYTYWIIALWLTVELFVSRDIKNTFRYVVLLGIPAGLKIYLSKK